MLQGSTAGRAELYFRRGFCYSVAAVPATFDRITIRNYLLAFVASGVFLSSLIGDRGIIEVRRARREYVDIAREIEALRRNNASLKDEADRLRTDPSTIEAIARKDLGFLRRDERLFIVRRDQQP